MTLYTNHLDNKLSMHINQLKREDLANEVLDKELFYQEVLEHV
jgi:hypothetical protein